MFHTFFISALLLVTITTYNSYTSHFHLHSAYFQHTAHLLITQLIYYRKFNAANIERFKLLLSGTCWQNVLNSNEVDAAFDVFWTEFSGMYEICFPLTTTKFNRNIHRINGFMTPGLLISRTTKNKLHKQLLIEPSPVNVNKFKTYRNLFNTLVRKSKIKFYEDS
jgi:hypothetical protein